MTDTDVLVVGGGLVGLACAAFLAQHGTRVLLAERRPSTSRHPKARLVTVRSMELYRSLGVEPQIRAAGEPNGGFLLADTLAGEHEQWIAPPEEERTAGGVSPVAPYSCDQQHVEPILRDRATRLGARLLFATTAVDVVTHDDHVEARLDGPDGRRQVRARYLVAADGADSAIRAQSGIGLRGQPVEGTALSVLFRADLSAALHGRSVDATMARKAQAFLFARGNPEDRLWQLGTHLRPDWASDTPATLRRHVADVIRDATGLADLVPDIDSVLTWTTGAYLAERLRHERVFLAGDSAHVMPPYGGLGGNTGVQDAHNLAWKLAAVCAGDAGDALLDTYQTERAPYDELIVAQALLRSRRVPGQPSPPDQIDATALALGFRYPTGEVEDPTEPSGQPGTRAAHVALHDGRTSLLDLLDPTGFTLVCRADRQVAGALRTAPVAGVRLCAIETGSVDPAHQQRFATVYGDAEGVLVRPDGVIAWRTDRPATAGDVRRARLRNLAHLGVGDDDSRAPRSRVLPNAVAKVGDTPGGGALGGSARAG